MAPVPFLSLSLSFKCQMVGTSLSVASWPVATWAWHSPVRGTPSPKRDCCSFDSRMDRKFKRAQSSTSCFGKLFDLNWIATPLLSSLNYMVPPLVFSSVTRSILTPSFLIRILPTRLNSELNLSDYHSEMLQLLC